ncbi:hypothetical protein BGX33_006711 [Mortierella sp. NVP41]|nr:hypothetical protein BGX33_006711 [Mortierella sp. NVP41]
MDWDPSREHDSRTFSEDYNLHEASGRSEYHTSVTRDEQFFMHNDDDSFDDADLDLIADVVDGKAPQQTQYQQRGGNNIRRAAHQTDENSVSSLMRYVLEGSQNPLDFQGLPAYDPTRAHHDQQVPHGGDEANEDIRDWSGSTPKRQTKHNSENIRIPKVSPVARRNLPPTRQSMEYAPRPVKHTRGLSNDEGFKPLTPVSSIPMRARSGSGAGQGAPSSTTRASADRNHVEPTPPPPPQPKPIFRSAMKPPSGSLGANNQAAGKRGRHIQLPTDLSDDDDDSDDDKRSQPSPPIANNKNQDSPESAEVASPIEVATEAPVVVAPASVPGPTRFTRISKANVSPAKKPIATIPTPQDTPQDEGNEEVQKSVKEMKAMLRRLGLMPLSNTLDAALGELDAVTVGKGGLCEMMGLVQKLGAMCERQKEVIDQMTDQIISAESRPQPQLQLQADPEAEEKLKSLTKQLADVQKELEVTKKSNQDMELEFDRCLKLATEDTSNRETKVTTKDNLVDASSQVSGSWATADALLAKRKDELTSKRTTHSKSELSSEAWRQHIQRIEKELESLKTVLDRSSRTAISTLKGRPESVELENLEERLYDALLENRRLQVKNKSLARELISTNIDPAEDNKPQSLKYEAMVRDVMLRLGVESPKQVMPALNEIEWIIQDVPRQRRFIAKAERIIWESEILEGTVRVQKHSQAGSEVELKKRQQQGDSTGTEAVDDGEELVIKPGRTCSQGYEATLQRLREWTELLDVLNHVEFADDFDDNATVLA